MHSPSPHCEEGTSSDVPHPPSGHDPWYELHQLATQAGTSVDHLYDTIISVFPGLAPQKSHTNFSPSNASTDFDEVVRLLSDEELSDELYSATKAEWTESLHPRDSDGRFRSQGGRAARGNQTAHTSRVGAHHSENHAVAYDFSDEEMDRIVPHRPSPFHHHGTIISNTIFPKTEVGYFFDLLHTIDSIHGDGNLPGLEVISYTFKNSRKEGAYAPDYKDGKLVAMSPAAAFRKLSGIHEIGHHLDDCGLQTPSGPDAARRQQAVALSDRFFSGGLKLDLPTSMQPPHLQDLHQALTNSEAYKDLQKILQTKRVTNKVTGNEFEVGQQNLKFVAYSLQPQELFARAYAQYIAMRSGDRELRSQLASLVYPMVKDKDGIVHPYPIVTHWRDKDFAPIAGALDRLFLRQKWLQESLAHDTPENSNSHE